MPKIPRMPPRRMPVQERSKGPAFLTDEFAPLKQAQREKTAEIMAQHISGGLILCMPYYFALCAKAIAEKIPDAVFHGVEYYRNVAENVSEVQGKKLVMHKMTLDAYSKLADGLRYDGAFIDYYGGYSSARADEIATFVINKMKPVGVFAVTMQGTESDMEKIFERLRLSHTITVKHNEEYTTTVRMVHGIVVLDGTTKV